MGRAQLRAGHIPAQGCSLPWRVTNNGVKLLNWHVLIYDAYCMLSKTG
jgi:hypothetical protein